MASLDPVIGSEQGGTRPVVIMQNNTGNLHAPTVIAVPITSSSAKPALPTHALLAAGEGGLWRDSIALCEQVRTLEKKRLLGYVGMLRPDKMRQVEQALLIAVGGIDKGDTPPYNKEETLSEERTETNEGTVEE